MVIELYKANGSWIAKYSGQGSAEIEHLFGTIHIPTAFTDKIDAGKVYAEIERLNPDAKVILLQV